ncbi:ribose 5-phosphate isomerase B [Synergistales bacterium]|nr:ribose 5-phosphate isomerase B [Synergistales bacterium]
MIIAVGCDHAGFVLKDSVLRFLKENAEIIDCGVFTEARVDYPDIAIEAARRVSEGKADLGVLMCGTGIGVSIAANKVRGIRAGVCNDIQAAKFGKAHNNLNVICLGGRVIDASQVNGILSVWLGTPFEGGRHLERIDKISAAEDSFSGVGR